MELFFFQNFLMNGKLQKVQEFNEHYNNHSNIVKMLDLTLSEPEKVLFPFYT